MPSSAARSRQRRSRTGCRNCRRKKKKCDEGKPTCFNCVKTSEQCVWGRPLSFLPQNAFTIAEDSTAAALTEVRLSATIESPSINNDDDDISEVDDADFTPDQTGVSRFDATSSDRLSRTPQGHHPLSPEVADPANDYGRVKRGAGYDSMQRGLTSISVDVPSTRPTLMSPPSSSHTGTFQPLNQMLDSTDRQPPAPSDKMNMFMQPDLSTPDYQPSPDMLTDDGIFMPGSTYQELHATLRDHVFHTAQSQDPSFQPSPLRIEGATHDQIAIDLEPGQQSTAIYETTRENGDELPEAAVFLEPDQEYLLWKNWVDEIADWLDKFDQDRHFGRALPVMAKTCAHLKYSMLALSARQLERKDGSVPSSLTLALYSAAVHLLIPQLHRRDLPILASCTVICVLEMMSCSPKAWRRHLDGCAGLVRSMNIHADSAGLERALFWCFIRMDMCGGLISRERTLIPIAEWTSGRDFDHAVTLFTSHPSADWSAGYACYLVGRVLDFLFADPTDTTSPQSIRATPSYSEQWRRLFTIIEHWYDTRPPTMHPLVTQPARDGRPFPTLLFGSGAAISGNQLHHTAALLMLQNLPRHDASRPQRRPPSSHSLLWHARRICAIAICNEHHGCWTNSIQPLWLAGQVMSHASEHQAIVDIYARIEKESGWGAMWRAEDLKLFWGDVE